RDIANPRWRSIPASRDDALPRWPSWHEIVGSSRPSPAVAVAADQSRSRRVRVGRLEALAGEGPLVELDAEPGSLRRCELAPPEGALALGDRGAEEGLGREPVRDARVAAPAQRLRGVRGGGDPDRAVERAREVGGQGGGDREGGRDAAD